MAESIPPLEGPLKDWEAEHTTPIVTDNGEIFVTYVDTDLHTTGAGRSLCITHLSKEDGTVNIKEARFRDAERILPPAGQPHEVRYRKECFGCNALGQCGMKFVQYDRQGNPIRRV